jgi:Co/Zn/Cd efflux system component
MASADNSQLVDAVGPKTRGSATAAEELVRSLISTDKDVAANPVNFGCCKIAGNVVVLILTTFLFALITAVQFYFGGVVTHSAALLEDCWCMLVDALSYFLNIWAELAPASMKRKLQLTVPIISLSVLTGLTIYQVKDAFATIKECQHGCEGDGVNPWIVWTFGFVGLIFDIISITAFCWNRKKQTQKGLPVNMLAAFMHVGSDFIRSLTTTIEGTIMFNSGVNTDLIDAWACVIITVCVLAAIMYGLYEVISDIRTFLRTGE